MCAHPDISPPEALSLPRGEARGRLVSIAARITGCMALAEDVVQDACLKLWQQGARSDVSNPEAYLYRMVCNGAVDCARRCRRDPCRGEGLADPDSFAASEPDPYGRVETCQILTLLLRELDRLPARTRRAFMLHRIQGVPQKRIAEEMSVSPALVNLMIRDAHAHCEHVLAACGDKPSSTVAMREGATPGAAELHCAFARLCGQSEESDLCPHGYGTAGELARPRH